MLISAAFPSEYLRAVDLGGKQVRALISHIEMRELGDGEHKPVLFFEGKSKGVVLNKTNANALAEQLGDNADDWGGHEVVLFSAKVSFQGRTVDAIRMRVPTPAEKKAAAKPQSTPQSENPADGMNDDVPF